MLLRARIARHCTSASIFFWLCSRSAAKTAKPSHASAYAKRCECLASARARSCVAVRVSDEARKAVFRWREAC